MYQLWSWTFQIIEDDVVADELCTRREYARWLVRSNIFIREVMNATSADPDFEYIQGIKQSIHVYFGLVVCYHLLICFYWIYLKVSKFLFWFFILALAEAGITLSGEDTNINFYPEREVYKEDISLLLHLLLFLFFIDVLLFQHLWFLQFCYPAPIWLTGKLNCIVIQSWF